MSHLFMFHTRFALPNGFRTKDFEPYLPFVTRAENMWDIRRNRKNTAKMAWLLSEATGRPIVARGSKHWVVVEGKAQQNSSGFVTGTGVGSGGPVAVTHPLLGETWPVPKAKITRGPSALVQEACLPLVVSVGYAGRERTIKQFSIGECIIGQGGHLDVLDRHDAVYYGRRRRKKITYRLLDRVIRESRHAKREDI